jgi:apolipoprotein D and lipocalin family protein
VNLRHALLALAIGCATTTSRLGLPPPDTASRVDLSRYAGTWFEIASFPNRFQRGCTATRATYTARDDGTIHVRNSCRIDRPDGPESAIEGQAWPVDSPRNTRLRVRFFWPLTGDYWILAVDDDYRWVLVGTPTRDNLWILARDLALDASTRARLIDIARARGFDTSRLVDTPQSTNAAP